MKQFETVYKELENLLIRKLPEYIEKINKKYNDNLILKPFENTSLEENCIKQPCFKIDFSNAEYSEKDRIIENEKYTFIIEIHLKTDNIIYFSRYTESVDNMINDVETWQDIVITGVKENKIYIQITV